MTFKVETEQETDGRWIAEIDALPGALAYGSTVEEATARVQALALRCSLIASSTVKPDPT